MKTLEDAYNALRAESRYLNQQAQRAGMVAAERIRLERDTMDQAADIVFLMMQENG